MEKRNWDAENAAPNQWTPEDDSQWQLDQYDNDDSTALFVSGIEDADERLYAAGGDEENDDEEDEDVNEDDQPGDWGHTDPAEGNSPFPDPMDPSGPGSAV